MSSAEPGMSRAATDVHGPDGRPAARAGSRAVAALLYGGTAAAALAAPRLAGRMRRRLPAPLADTLASAVLVGGGWLTIAAVERARPFRRDWNRSRGDVLTDVLSMVATGAAAEVASERLVAPLRRGMAGRNTGRALRRLPLPVQLGITISGFDLVHAAHHRLLHEHGSLWRFHAVHHSVERLYWFNATRFHFVEMLVDGVLERLVLSALGVEPSTLVAHRVFRGIYGQIQHGNVDLDSGALNAVLSTPERHRWHHSTEVAEGNTNYGAVVCLWDRLWGTDFLPEGRAFDAEIGNGMAAFPRDWAGQQLAPLRWSTIASRPGSPLAGEVSDRAG